MESLTSYQANRIKVGVRIVRWDTAAPNMESLTACQDNKKWEQEQWLKGYSWTCHGITHSLSSQEDQIIRMVRIDTTASDIKSNSLPVKPENQSGSEDSEKGCS